MLFVFGLNAQNDTSVLHLNRLSTDDLLSQKRDSQIYQTSLVNWSNLPLHQSPFETYIFTKDEIALLGCNTLVDILKFVPSIRTSKVGVATEGELFLSNGLRGNEYFQFLINGSPLRNLTINGMSIGAQFPIKQAEKIEIYIGNATSIYGMQAGAGVINIVLKESERPIYTTANLTFGAQQYNNISVNFGGKLGKGKRITTFNAFGGYTTFNDWNNRYLYDTNFNQSNYDAIGNYKLSGNYRPEQSDTSFFIQAAQPHFSRYFGLNLQIRRFYISYLNMIRHDHSAIGLNPAAIDYTDESTYFEDNINKITIGYKVNSKKWFFDLNLGSLAYQVNKQSSSRFIYPHVVSMLDTFSKIISRNFSDVYVGGYEGAKQRIMQNQSYSNSNELSFPVNFVMKRGFFHSLTFSTGIHSILAIANNPIYIYATRNNLEEDGLKDFSPKYSDPNINVNAYFMSEYQRKKSYVNISISKNYNTLYNTQDVNFRIGINQHFKIKTNHFSFASSIDLGKVTPSIKNIANTYSVDIFKYFNKWYVNSSSNPPSTIDGLMQKTYRVALRQYNSKRWIDISYEHIGRQSDYIFNNLKISRIDSLNTTLFSGFLVSPSHFVSLHKATFVFCKMSKKMLFSHEIFKKNPQVFSRFSYTYQFGEERFENGNSIPFIRQVPTSTLKWHSYLDALKYVSFGWNLNFNSAFYPSITTPENYKSDAIKYYKDNTRNLSMDFMIAYHFNQNFYTQLRIFNLTNRNIAGIEATETPDDLKINTQPHRIFQVALHYNLDVQPQ